MSKSFWGYAGAAATFVLGFYYPAAWNYTATFLAAGCGDDDCSARAAAAGAKRQITEETA